MQNDRDSNNPDVLSLPDEPNNSEEICPAPNQEKPEKNRTLHTQHIFITCILFGLVGFLNAWHTIASDCIVHIIQPAQGIVFQGVEDRTPTPHLLAWSLSEIGRLIALNGLKLPVILVPEILLYSLLWMWIAHLFNPDYLPIRLKNPGTKGLFDGAFETDQPLRTSLLILFSGALVFAIWQLTPLPKYNYAALYLPRPGMIWMIRYMLIGLVIWFSAASGGIGDTFLHGPAVFRGKSLIPTCGKGLLWGAAVYLSTVIVEPTHIQTLLMHLQTLGTFNISLFLPIEHLYILCSFCAWISAGILLCFLIPNLSKASISNFSFKLLSVLEVTVIVVGCISLQWFSVTRLVKRYDLEPSIMETVADPYSPLKPTSGVPDGPMAAAAFSKLVHVPFGTSSQYPDTNVLVFRGHKPTVSVLKHGYTLDGLSANRVAMQRTLAFLKARRYVSSLSWMALKHMFDCYTLRFNTTKALHLLLLDMKYGPHPSQCDLAIQTMLFTCAATPQNRELLNDYGNPNWFTHKNRFACRLIGDMYRRMGEASQSLKWYRKADMPPSFMQKMKNEKPMFNQGEVTGRIVINGKPASGMRIGIMPWRMNGLTPYVSLLLQNSIGEIYSPRAFSPLFGQFCPSPYAFRWLSASATTDSEGRFTVSDLTEGQYRLMLALPSTLQLKSPFDPGLSVSNSPTPFVVNYQAPRKDLGTVYINISVPHKKIRISKIHPEPQ